MSCPSTRLRPLQQIDHSIQVTSFDPEVVLQEGVLFFSSARCEPFQNAVELASVFELFGWFVYVAVGVEQRLKAFPTEAFSFSVPMLSIV